MDNIEQTSENNEQNEQHLHSAERKQQSDKVADAQNTILSYLHDLVFLLAALLLLFVMLFRIVVVSGPSMNSTLLNGDYLLVLSSSVYSNPKQGDVVVISKDTFKDGEPIVKRVIATGGQTVDIEGGIVYVDGVKQDGEYTTPNDDFNFPLKVDEGCVFVMGDNRDQSKDSRSSEIGIIDEREVLGKVLLIALPAEDQSSHRRNFSRIGAV